VIVNVKNGLGNRLRAFASAASVAASLGRPLMVVWVSDLHCNCSLRNLLQLPREMVVLEEELPLANLTADRFQVPSSCTPSCSRWTMQYREDSHTRTRLQVYNYMRPEPGAVKDELVRTNSKP